MMSPRPFFKTACGIFLILFLMIMSVFLQEVQDLNDLYFNAQFASIASRLQEREADLPLEEKLLYIECLARTAQGRTAQKELLPLLDRFSDSADVLAAAGITAFSNGRFDEARLLSDKALRADPDTHKARLTMVQITLYKQDFATARRLYEDLKKRDSNWEKSYFLYLVGLELYKASRFPDRLCALYQAQASSLRRHDRERYENTKKNAKMCKNMAGRNLFDVTGPDKITLPWVKNPSNEENIILPVRAEGDVFELVLDTGNAVGWMVHNRDLHNRLEAKIGGRALTQIGIVSGLLYGHNVYNERIDLEGCQLLHLLGMYVPKPHPSFYDANLNPIFLRDRAVTFDFVEDQVIFRTRERLERDLETALSKNPDHFVNLPFYGYERPLVPLEAEGKRDILCLFETGAEDITIRLDLAHELGLPMESSLRYLASGEIVRYSKAPVSIRAGQFRWTREEAEVWSLDRFYDRLTGLTPDVIIGPKALRGRLVLTFDPFRPALLLSDVSF